MKKFNKHSYKKSSNNKLESLIKNSELFNFIQSNIDLNFNKFGSDSLNVINSPKYENVQQFKNNSLEFFINLNKINDIRRINYYLIELNNKFKENGILICNVETIDERRIRILKKTNYIFFTIFYPIDFFYKRIMPKTIGLKKIYFAISKGKNRVLSKCETLGRLYYCGFELINMKEIDNRLYFIMKKVKEPVNDKNPSYHLIYKKRAIGKDGEIIYVYKLRTMHPYSEYLQKYIHEKYQLEDCGKFKNDLRLTGWGKILRKLFIDELPQFINLFRGEISLVGVRALSEHYFSLYPKDMQKLRTQYKPGLVPPYYVDMPNSFGEIIESERKYLLQKQEHPFQTDVKYFFKAWYNIIFKKARSK